LPGQLHFPIMSGPFYKITCLGVKKRRKTNV